MYKENETNYWIIMDNNPFNDASSDVSYRDDARPSFRVRGGDGGARRGHVYRDGLCVPRRDAPCDGGLFYLRQRN